MAGSSDAPGTLTTALADRYRVEREIGAGGMATVYLAHDIRHDRQVALKVLRPELSAIVGAERFLQEIKTTAHLQHPHILPLHDSGEAGGNVFYVMPYVEGESLRDRLQREKQLPVEDAVRIAQEVASALDYAHRKGVVHRDIKPENILLHDGQALVADFGISLAVSRSEGGARMTETGMSLGTPSYMAPEQAMGEREISAKADIYALGCVLYEMLIGEPPFTGSTAQAIVARSMTERPRAIAIQRHTVPPQVEAAVFTALEKLPADRFATAAEFASALDADARPMTAAGLARASAASPRGRPAPAFVPWAVTALALVVALWTWMRPSGASTAGGGTTVDRWSIVLPDSAPLAFVAEAALGIGRTALAISPDGRTLVYVARTRGGSMLYRRRLDELTVAPIAGTEDAFDPFFSRDGQWVGFFVGTDLRKVPIGGGTATTLAAVPEPAGAAWAADGRILVAAREGTNVGWVPATGGELQLIPGPATLSRSDPKLLAGDTWALVHYWAPTRGVNGIGLMEVATGRTFALTTGGLVSVDSLVVSDRIDGSDPRYLSTGHLTYAAGGRLFALPIDRENWKPTGPAVEVLSDLRHEANGMQAAVTENGTLVFASGGSSEGGVLAWADATGRIDSLPFPSEKYGTFDVSPDGKRVVALTYPTGSLGEVHVLDLERGSSTKVALRGIPLIPRWWPDGRRVVFTERSPAPPVTAAVVRQLAGSAGERDTLLRDFDLSDISPDSGHARVAGTRGFGGGAWLATLGKPGAVVAIDSFPTAWGPTFSRDGRWIAYTSNEAGRYEIYVVSANLQGERQKVSLSGGEEPRWSQKGDALVYRWGNQWFSVGVPAAGSNAFGRPRLVLQGAFINVPERSHDLSPDGRRHLVVVGPRVGTASRLNVVTNWLSEVRRLAPGGRP